MKVSVSAKRPESLLQIWLSDRTELAKAAVLFGYLFCVVAASTIGRTAADTLFLSRYDAKALSLMYLPQAGALLLLGIAFQRMSARFRLDRLLYGVIATVAGLSLITRAMAGFGGGWIFPVIYVAYDLFNFLMIVCFWQFATAVMDQRKAKRTIGLVGSGGIVGGIVSGFCLKAIAHPLGTENLIFLYAALQLFCLPLVAMLIRRAGDPSVTFAVAGKGRRTVSGERRKKPGRSGASGLFRHVPHLKYVALMAGALVISLTLIDFQFKSILRHSLQNEALAGFMGSFYGFAGLLALLVQLFVTGKLISRVGVMTALLVFPIALFAGSFALLAVPVLWIAVAVKGSDKVLGDTIYSSVSQLIMFPIAPEWRGKAKSFLDGIVRNGAKGLAAVSLIALSHWLTPYQLSYVVVALMACCIAAAIRIKGAYLTTLLATLKTQEMDVRETEIDYMDAISRQVLLDALHSDNKLETLFALRVLLEWGGFELRPHLPRLLAHPEREVRLEALKAMGLAKPEDGPALLQPLLSADDAHVRAEALFVLSGYAGAEWIERITDALEDPEVEAKAAAIAGLVKYYGVEGMFRAVGTLKMLLSSESERERMAMAALFGTIGVRSFYKPLIPLLADRSPQVAASALASAAELCVPELVPCIVPLLARGDTREPAIAALAAYGEAVALPLLQPYLSAADASLHLPLVFERIETERAFGMLLERYETAAAELRGKLLESMVRLRRKLALPPVKQAERLALQEAEAYWRQHDWQRALGGFADLARVADEVVHMKERTVWRLFQLLALIREPATINAVYANWTAGDARRQANAAEAMDQLLEGELRTAVAAVMGPLPAGSASANDDAADEALVRLFALGDWWLHSLIRHAVRGVGHSERLPRILRKLEETAADASGEASGELMERVLLLRNVKLFHGLPGRELVAIADSLQEERVSPQAAIIREGETGDSLYVIKSGAAGVYLGRDKLGALGSGDCFGEMAVLMEGPRTATVVAEEEALLWRLDAGVFHGMMFDRTEIALEMMKLLSRRLRGTIAAIGTGEEAEPAAFSLAAASEQAAATREGEPGGDDSEAAASAAMLTRMLMLQKIGLFARLPREDILRLAAMVEEIRCAPGEAICREGEDGDALYGIMSGGVRVHRGTETIALLEAGACFGEMAVIDGSPRSADCTAAEDTVLLRLAREQVFAFCFQRRDVLISMMRVLAERLKTLQERAY